MESSSFPSGFPLNLILIARKSLCCERKFCNQMHYSHCTAICSGPARLVPRKFANDYQHKEFKQIRKRGEVLGRAVRR